MVQTTENPAGENLLSGGDPVDAYIPGTEPFYFPGGGKACLLVHGFGGTPREMREYGLYLASRGITVSGVCLTGHALAAGQPCRVPWRRWVAGVETEMQKLQSDGKKVFLGGLSMGGAISLHLAARYQLAGVVTVCAPVYINLVRYLPSVWKFLRRLDKEIWLDIQDARARAVHSGSESVNPLWGLELLKLLRQARRGLKKINAPLLMFQALEDRTIPPENALFIYRSVSSRQKDIVWLNDSGHVATEDRQKQLVFERTGDFICNLQDYRP